MKITYCAAASLDGFIARDDGDVSWLDEMNIDAKDCGLEEFFASVDGLVMGRKTYDFVFDYGSWPYEDKPTWVCTHRDVQLLQGANLRISRTIDDVVAEANSLNLQHLWLVGGGKLASSFLAKDLLTHVSLSEMPIKLERGIPLFADHKLEEIGFTERRVMPKNGFRQIEIAINS